VTLPGNQAVAPVAATVRSSDAVCSGNNRTIGILAGSGNVPREIVENLRHHGQRVHVVALRDSADDVEAWPVSSFEWVGIAQLGAMLSSFQTNGCRELIIIGGVRRPDLRRVVPDLGFFTNLPAVLSLLRGGDDHLLRRVIRFFEGKGFVVRGIGDLVPDLLAAPGQLSKRSPSDELQADAALGFDVLQALGRLDMGQAAIVRNGCVLAVEGVEGTDKLLERVGKMKESGSANQSDGVLVKMAKPGQDIRVDLPTIGPNTIENCRRAGLSGIALEGGKTVIAERSTTIVAADAAGISVWGIERSELSESKTASDKPKQPSLETMGMMVSRKRPSRGALRDAWCGGKALAQLAPFGYGTCAVVSRGHVLAVGLCERSQALIERAGRLKQWGDGHAHKRRRGVAVLAADELLDNALIATASRVGLEGIYVASGNAMREDLVRLKDLAQQADEAGIFLLGGL